MTRTDTLGGDVEDLRARDADDGVDRQVPDLDPAEYDGFEDAPADHRLATAGLASYVYSGEEETLGHVVVLDLDDVDPATAFEEAARLDDPAVVLRTSPSCYHVVGLRVRPWEDALDVARASRSCGDYVDEMDVRGRFIARTFEKVRQASGDLYKPTPEPVLVVDGDGPVSRPHATRLRQLAEEVGREDVAEALGTLVERNGTVGRLLTQSRYETITDELREVVGPAEVSTDGE